MIDNFTLLLTHGLIMVALWRMLSRPDLDEDGTEAKPQHKPWSRQRGKAAREHLVGPDDA